ncbi:MAG: peptidoglycan DD-metalloendopeptidase family protein [Bacteroidia bacterium]|nr:peptidoglycan DD-metalloendopeptidase family protein [Bacteroidia bacterium]
MRLQWVGKWLLGLFICILGINDIRLLAQHFRTRESLEKERTRLEEQVGLTNQLLRETKSIRKSSYSELNLLSKQIEVRERLVSNLELEVKAIDRDIEETSLMANAMNQDVVRLQQNFGKVAWQIYKSHNKLNILLWLLSSENFRQAYDRLRYFKEFSKFRNQQIRLLKRAKAFLAERIKALETKKAAKEELLGRKKIESKELAKTKEEKNELYRNLRKKEQEYRRQIREYKRNLAELQRQIDNMIREEIARVASEKSTQNTGKSSEINEVVLALSEQFEKNKGKLPWPMPQDKGIITGTFGLVEDASGGKVHNNGIYISTPRDQTIRSIFGGKVTAINTIPVFGKVVIIQHGNYRSVYANLREVFVNVGDKVEPLQNIGIVKTNQQTGDTQLHFLIYKDKEPVDPASWIIGR